MSSFGALQGGAASAQPKQISNRLLNMKFMQRAAASSGEKNSSNPSTPSQEPRLKRRRTGDFSFTAQNLRSPSTPSTATNTPTYGDRTAISGASATNSTSDSAKRGINNFDAPGIETEWVLNVRLPVTNATSNGADEYYESEDQSEEDSDDDIWSPTEPRGRQTYGSFKKKRKTADTNPASGTTTPASTSQPGKKRGRDDDLDDEELSPLSSGPDSDAESDGEIQDTPPRPKKKGAFDFNSEADLKKMDSIDFSKSGFEHGFGRQRHGLAGKGGFASPANRPPRKPKKKARKTM